jgi:hypothetical protein
MQTNHVYISVVKMFICTQRLSFNVSTIRVPLWYYAIGQNFLRVHIIKLSIPPNDRNTTQSLREVNPCIHSPCTYSNQHKLKRKAININKKNTLQKVHSKMTSNWKQHSKYKGLSIVKAQQIHNLLLL